MSRVYLNFGVVDGEFLWAMLRVRMALLLGRGLTPGNCHMFAPGHCMTRWLLEVEDER